MFVEACHVIFLRKLAQNSMPHKRRGSFELLVLQYTLENTPDNSEAGIQLFIGISTNGFQDPTALKLCFPNAYIQVICLIASDVYNYTILVCIRALIETETNSELPSSIRNTSYLNHYV